MEIKLKDLKQWKKIKLKAVNLLFLIQKIKYYLNKFIKKLNYEKFELYL